MKITKPDDIADAPAIAGCEAETRSEATSNPLNLTTELKHPVKHLIELFS